MNIALRVDASVQIGSGHVMRCLTLADELRRRGNNCEFICRPHPGHLGEVISARGFRVNWLKAATAASRPFAGQLLAHDHWLGADWRADAEQTQAVLGNETFDWLVVDHYGLDARWESRLAETALRVMVIDDLADRHHQCQLLLDQNVLNGATGETYERLVNTDCLQLLGPNFALLGPEYSRLAALLPERTGVVARVLVFVGGSDPFHLTETCLEALASPRLKNVCVDVVVGPNHPAPGRVRQLAACRPGTSVYSSLPSLAGLMLRADLMLGGGGATNWERLCLGLPAVVVSTADNQEGISRSLDDSGLVHYLGKAGECTVEDMRQAVLSLACNPARTAARSRVMRQVVDGKGTARVVDSLCNGVGCR